MLSHVPSSQRKGMGWPAPIWNGQEFWSENLNQTPNSDQNGRRHPWRRTKDGARKRLRTTSLLQSKLLYLLLGCRFYSQITAIVNDVVIAPSFFFSTQFCFVISSRTLISERFIQDTLNDARSNPLLDETMSSSPVSPRDSHFQFSSP